MLSLNRRFIPALILWITPLLGLSALFTSPANAFVLPVWRKTLSDTKIAFRQTQYGLAGAGLFENVNGGNTVPALQGVSLGSGVGVYGEGSDGVVGVARALVATVLWASRMPAASMLRAYSGIATAPLASGEKAPLLAFWERARAVPV